MARTRTCRYASGDGRRKSRFCGFPSELGAFRIEIETLTGTRLSYAFLNRYRDGADDVAWHDDRDIPGRHIPVVASLMLGATRVFDIGRKADRTSVVLGALDHGDLVIVRGRAQSPFEHRSQKIVASWPNEQSLLFDHCPMRKWRGRGFVPVASSGEAAAAAVVAGLDRAFDFMMIDGGFPFRTRRRRETGMPRNRTGVRAVVAYGFSR